MKPELASNHTLLHVSISLGGRKDNTWMRQSVGKSVRVIMLVAGWNDFGKWPMKRWALFNGCGWCGLGLSLLGWRDDMSGILLVYSLG